MKRVLLVEDEILIREIAYLDLVDAGFAVESADNGEEAFALLVAGHHFDVLVTDIRMPGSIDGWELGRKARELLPSIKTIYTTGSRDVPDDTGPNSKIVGKPYEISELITLIAA